MDTQNEAKCPVCSTPMQNGVCPNGCAKPAEGASAPAAAPETPSQDAPQA